MDINETNFHDIRRNFIFSSILLLLFLIYGTKIKLEQLLIFKFDTNGDWAIISPYWDIGIIFLVFFLYTFLRYLIYGIDDINKNRYSQLLLIEILKSAYNKGGDIYKELKCSTTAGEDIFFSSLIIDNSNTVKGEYQIILRNDNTTLEYLCPRQITKLKILKNKITFSDIEIKFKSNDIVKDFGPSKLNLISRKEFSDFWWPLLLVVPISILIILRLIDFLICL